MLTYEFMSIYLVIYNIYLLIIYKKRSNSLIILNYSIPSKSDLEVVF